MSSPSVDKVKSIFRSVWFWPITIFIVLVLLTKGRLLMASVPLLRIAIPVAVVYLGYRVVKRQIKKSILQRMHMTEDMLKRHMGQGGYPRPGMRQQGTPETIIEICPKCGTQKGRRCPDACT